MIRKIYIRSGRGGFPENENSFAAYRGFYELGVEVESFFGFGDLYTKNDISTDVAVHGYVDDVHIALRELKKKIPPPLDYPEELQYMLGRPVWKTHIGNVRIRLLGDCVFVKPVQHKLFTGFVWDGGPSSRRSVVTLPSSTEVWCSEIVDFKSEYRVFVLEGEIIGVKNYKGDWSMAPDRGRLLEAVAAYKSAPVAYSIDVGIVGVKTLLVEVNDSYALGHYGLNSVLYAKMISARWEEMTK